MAVATLQENVGIHAGFHHIRRSPFAGDHGVQTQMPPEVISELLGATVDFPFAQNLKAFRIHYEDAAWAVSCSGTQCAAENSLRPAMDRVGPAVSSPFREDIGLNHLDNLRLSG